MTTEPDELLLLADQLDALATWLGGHGEATWQEQVMGEARRVRRRDPDGLLAFLRGVGGLVDLYFSPANENAESDEQGQRLNSEFQALLSAPAELAGKLRHEAQDASGSHDI